MYWTKIRSRGICFPSSRFASRLSRYMFSSIASRLLVAWPALFASHRPDLLPAFPASCFRQLPFGLLSPGPLCLLPIVCFPICLPPFPLNVFVNCPSASGRLARSICFPSFAPPTWPSLTWPSLNWPLLNWPLLDWPSLNWPLLNWPSLNVSSSSAA